MCHSIVLTLLDCEFKSERFPFLFLIINCFHRRERLGKNHRIGTEVVEFDCIHARVIVSVCVYVAGQGLRGNPPGKN